jgi:hypothetical protein
MGRRVGEVVARRLGRTLLELGGNNAIVVAPSADLKLALRGVLFASVGTAGQRCTSTRRLIVHESIYAEFMRQLTAAYEHVRIGDPLDPKTLMGPLIDERAVEGYEAAIAAAKEHGGRVLWLLRARGRVARKVRARGHADDDSSRDLGGRLTAGQPPTGGLGVGAAFGRGASSGRAANDAAGTSSPAPRPAHRCTLPHSSSKVWTRTWFDRRLTSAGTRAMSGGKSNSAGRPATVRKRRPAGSACGGRNGRWLATTKPHSPKLGTCAWYGAAVRPALSIVVTTVQKLFLAISGDVVCTTA